MATNISARGTPLLLAKKADSSNQFSAFRALWDATNNAMMELNQKQYIQQHYHVKYDN
jgi:hypothetical protein